VVRDAVAEHGGAIPVDVGLEVADLVVNLVDGLEPFLPGRHDLDRPHVKRLAARHGPHVENDRVGETLFDARPVAPVGRHEDASDDVLDLLALAK
jgi:hypothetical protein